MSRSETVGSGSAILGAILFAGCFASPDYSAMPCGVTQPSCPSGYHCSLTTNHCSASLSPDGAIADEPKNDAQPTLSDGYGPEKFTADLQADAKEGISASADAAGADAGGTDDGRQPSPDGESRPEMQPPADAQNRTDVLPDVSPGEEVGTQAGSGNDASGDAVAAAGPPATLAFRVQPVNSFANQPLPAFSVMVEDSNGQLVASSTATITIAIKNNPTGANLLGSAGLAAVGGVATYTGLGLDQPGSGYTLVASSGSLSAAISAPFDLRKTPFGRVTTGLYGGIVGSVAIAGGTPLTLYAGTGVGVYKSINGGGTWSLVNFGHPGGAELVVVDPKTPANLYTAPDLGPGVNGPVISDSYLVAKSADGGQTWRSVGQGLAGGVLAVDPIHPAILYAGNSTSLQKSTDGGETWSSSPLGAGCRALAIDPVVSSTLYAFAYDLQQNKGIYKSTDSGSSWTALTFPVEKTGAYGLYATPSAVFVSSGSAQLFRSSDGGTTWTQLAATGSVIAYAPSNVSRVYLGSSVSVAVSTDGGLTFSSPVPLGERFSIMSPYSLAVDPVDAMHVFAATENGVLISTDGGATWSNSSTGIDVLPLGTIAMNPASPATLIVGGRAATYRTTDAGVGWSRVANVGMQALLIDSANPLNVYGCDANANFYRSGDNGATWSTGVKTADSSAFYCYNIVVRGQNVWIPTVGGGLRYSSDGGGSWNATAVTSSAYAVAADPAGNTLYAGTTAGTFKSTDTGKTWTSMVATDIASSILVDPLTSTTIYAGMQGKINMSLDSGASWTLATTFNGPVAALVGSPSGSIYAVGSHAFATSPDHGTTWTFGGEGILGTASSIAVTSDGQTLYVGTDLGLYKSTSGGR